MLDTIRHRGPDSHGVWLNDFSGLLPGHARLSIQELSSIDHQSMHSVSGRYCLVFNG
jgi:asparagine synthase (glutamine-hydrolysing)